MKNLHYLTEEIVSRENQNALLRYIGMLPNPDKILSRTGKTIDSYRDLKNDPHLWACIQSRKSGLLSLEYELEPNGASQSVVGNINRMFSELDVQQIERDILEAPLFGFQPLEIIWKLDGDAGKFIQVAQIVAKPQEWFLFDNEGNFRFRKAGEPDGVIPPPMKILCVQYEPSYMNPYGHSLLAKCYWHVTFKNGGLKFWVNFTEKYGMPILVGQYTRGASFEESQRLADELAKLTEDAVIVAPSDIKLELHEPVRSTSVELYRELIKYCNAEISKAILSQTLTTELDMGSYAASQTHYQIRREVILSDKRLVESTMNKLIRYIVELNFPGSPSPKFVIKMEKEIDEKG